MAIVPGAFDNLDELPAWRRIVPLILAVLLAAALGLIVYLADRAAEQRDLAIARQRNSFEIMMLADHLNGTIASSEVLLARYVVSLDKNVGRQFQDEWRTTLAEVAALELAARGNPAQLANVRSLRAIIEERGKTLNDIALRTTYKQRLGALGRFYIAGKSKTVPRLRDALQRTIDHEQNELAKYNAQVNSSVQRVSRVNDTYGVIGVAILAAGLLALWFAYGASRERRFERRLAQSEAARVDGLEIAVRQRTEELQAANAQLRDEMEERARAEQNLRQLQKMEAIGKLTGGIAHDFNNMLAVILSGIELAGRALPSNPAKVRRHLADAKDSVHRAATLTDRLLGFARPAAPAAGPVAVDALVHGMHALIERATDDGITVHLDLDAGEWKLWVEPAQLENAILNLVINARDAMDGRGSLTIRTRRTTLAQHEIGQCEAGDYVSISVTDTGCGMSADVIERIFEPFFTTKPIGKGTGLGLSQIFSFARTSDGEIEVLSAPGEGATFRILLPRTDRTDAPAPTTESAPERPRPQSALEEAKERGQRSAQLILVVEDDPRVLRATLEGLEALGYRGLSCNHPHKAAELLRQHPETTLILSDVLMPDMTGPEMIDGLAATPFSKPVVFVTGFAGDSEGATRISGVPVLRKPFTQEELARAIEKALLPAE